MPRDTDGLISVTRRAFAEFLALPAAMVAAFVLLALVTYALDRAGPNPVHAALEAILFRNAATTGDLLTTIASSIITVTSITISLLLIAVQQAAATLTHQVFDQFLRRRVNQSVFGYFIGLAMFTLLTLATVDETFNPVIGAATALLLTIIALLLLLLILYSTIDQMRPAEIVATIHAMILRAREHQADLLGRTRRATVLPPSAPARRVLADRHGFLTAIDLACLEMAVQNRADAEVVIMLPIGRHVAFGGILAEVRVEAGEEAPRIADEVARALRIEQQRNIDTDPAYGIEQLHTIAWSSTSTAKSNPDPGRLCIFALRDVLARWTAKEQAAPDSGQDADRGRPLAVVYNAALLEQLIDKLHSLTVAASESMLHPILSEVLVTYTTSFPDLPDHLRQRVEDNVLSSLSALGDHVPTSDIDDALAAFAVVLDADGRATAAASVRAARSAHLANVGKLGSRGTRAEPS